MPIAASTCDAAMETIQVFQYLHERIRTVIMATNDESGKPVTCAADIMDYDENGLYFLTAKGKNFYRRLKENTFPLRVLKAETHCHALPYPFGEKSKKSVRNVYGDCSAKILICTKYIRPNSLAKH